MSRMDFYWILNYSTLPERNCCYGAMLYKGPACVKWASWIEMVLEGSDQIRWLVRGTDRLGPEVL